jgi:glyoxylase-like metal-dependent hydrolase (beta-lactamase superfamily II)
MLYGAQSVQTAYLCVWFEGLANDAGQHQSQFLSQWSQCMTDRVIRSIPDPLIARVPLSWTVFVTPSVPTVSDDLPPGEMVRMWSPISSTLIYGERDAVLVDAPTTVEQAATLADWVVASGKNLTTIYVTHGHGDHFFGIGTLQDRFPQARAIATADVVELMHRQVSPEVMEGLWNKRFPGQIPERLVMAERLENDTFQLEGHDLVAVEVGHTDTDSSTCLYVPGLGLVVAGDVAYNDVHLYLTESRTHESRMEWIAALDKVEALNPRAVIAGHKRVGNDDGPRVIEETRQYIRNFDRLVEETTTSRELYDRMLGLYPDRVNRGALWGSVRALKG